MKNAQKLLWINKVNNFKKANIFPKKWKSATMLAHMIARIDPVLLQADHSFVHSLLGHRLEQGPDKTWVETRQFVLPLQTAKRIMDSPEFDKARKDLLDQNFGDEIQRIGALALKQLEGQILDSNMEAIKIGLEMSGKYTKHVKHTHESEKKKADRLKDLVKESFKHDDVAQLQGNH